MGDTDTMSKHNNEELLVKTVITNFALEGIFFTDDEKQVLKECARGTRNIQDEIRQIIAKAV